MDEEIKVNDGGGLYDSVGLIDSLIIDCNDLPKKLMEGQYIHFCAKLCEMVQKLDRLKGGVKADMDAKDILIKELRSINDTMAADISSLMRGEAAHDARPDDHPLE